MYVAQLSNISSLYQTVTGFQDKNPVLTFQHYGPEVYCSLELLDNSDVLVGSQNRVFPATLNWVNCNMGYYSGIPTATKCRVTFYSDNDLCQIVKVILQPVYGFVGMNLGDVYNDTRDTLSISARKFFFGSSDEVISTRPERFDIRSDFFIKGNLTVNGSVFSEVIYGPPGSMSFATNIIFSSGSTTLLNWSSGLVQTLDTTSYGVVSGSATISSLTYIYLDLDISTSILQTSTTYTDAIGNQKIFLGTAQNQSVGNVSFTSQSGQTPIVSGQQLTPSSVTFDKITVNSLSALTANMGTLTAGIITLGSGGSYLNFGALPPTSSSGSAPTAGLFQDYTGLYALSGTTLNASLTQDGLSAAGGNVIADVNGLTLYSGGAFAVNSSLKINDLSTLTNAFYLYSFNNSGLVQQETHLIATSPVSGRSTFFDLFANGVASTNAYLQLRATADSITGSIVITGGSPSSSCIITATTITSAGDIVLSNLNLGSGLSGTPNGTMKMIEVSAPSAPNANEGVLYLEDNGAGKTKLMIRFNTGASQQIAIQP